MESQQQIVDRLKALRDARRASKAPAPVAATPVVPTPVDDGITVSLDRNGGVVSFTNVELLPSIAEVMEFVDAFVLVTGRTLCLTFLGQAFHGGTDGDPTQTATEVEADVKIEITAPFKFHEALTIRWHEDKMPKPTEDLIQRLLSTAVTAESRNEGEAIEGFRQRLEHCNEEGWLFDENASQLGLDMTRACWIARNYSKEKGRSLVALTTLSSPTVSPVALFFDPEDTFYRALDHTNEPFWDFDHQREMMGLSEDEAQAVLKQWMRDHKYQV